MGRGRVRLEWVIGGVAALTFGLVACGGFGGDDASKFDKVGSQIAQNESGRTDVALSSFGDSKALPTIPGAKDLSKTAIDAQQATRDVIYTGHLQVRVPDAEKAAGTARRIADAAGGYLARQDADLSGQQEVSATLRVPSTEFDSVMDRVAALGKVEDRKVDSEDVTSQVVDLQGRLKNAETSADRLRELIATADNVNNIISIEDRLTQRETQIEAITGQLQTLKDQARFATVRVTFTEKATPKPKVEKQPKVSKRLPGFVKSLKSGGVTFANIFLALMAALAFALPFLALGGVVWFVVRRVQRMRGGPVRPATTPPTPPTAA